MNKGNKYKSAAMIGRGLAILQHSFDKFFEWGFREMKKSANKPEQNPSKLSQFIKKIGGFLGVMGEKYYEKYEDLKKKDK